MTTKKASWLTQYVTDPLSSGLDYALGGSMPNGATEQNAAAIAARAAAKSDAASAAVLGPDLLKYTLAGAGLGLGGAKLYHLLSGINKPKQKYTKFGPGSKSIDEDEKIAEAGILETISSAPGNLLNKVLSNPADRGAARAAALVATTGLGIYGGSSLMNAIIAQKKKDELNDQVDAAKKEYQRALIGRKAAALDAAFNKFAEVTKQADNPLLTAIGSTFSGPLTAVSGAAKAVMPAAAAGGTALAKLPFDIMRQYPAVWNAYVMSTLGLGALSGKMTYDWTRERSRDKAVSRAQKARARIAGAAPIYVDPEQIAAIKQIAD